MPNDSQMDLDFPEVCLMNEQWPKLLETITNVANAVGRKKIVHDLEVSRSALDNILTDRDRHALKAKHLIYLLLCDETGMILKQLADLTNHKVEPKRKLTPEERGRAIEEEVLRKLGPMGQEIIDSALKGAGE